MSANEKATWFMSLIASVQTLAEELGLDDLSTQKLREFVLTTAKNEYMAGNRSGISWARKNPTRGPVAAAS
ncbi:hypothetical protein A2856_00675 [Candidatus Uhrbacteria bacterium RIFCSPHIGHO2_01_FULL_63_20]|uniref:Uncharacterized protein n=1 Tax=Candidatus Uhrbacteria bacterium RIFCSPHIGHO2_01_FULL_63_20 TaxID=1802385 RepID=A0A1F7TLY5_9BACT|nr:MAG: hypothetical protein A2856_00675 [Candidatus Uhrbacteria bacterium RIFCSPHIGHO2_01_FULL_63_20]